MESPFGPTRGSRSVFGLTPQVSSQEAHSKQVMQSLARLFNDARYSDATIRLRNVTLPAFQGSFLEGSSGVLSFEEDSGAAHWRVFEYLYTGNYSEDLSTIGFEDDPALLKDPRVYALADMFFLEDLKVLAQSKLQEKLKNSWMSDAFPDCIREIYASTQNSDSRLRSVVVEIAMAHACELCKNEFFKELLQDGGDFAVENVDILTKKMRP